MAIIKLKRLWRDIDEHNLILLNRPRVSIEIDKYIWNMIEQNIILPKKIMQSRSHNYTLVVSLSKYNTEKDKYFPLSPYNGTLTEAAFLSASSSVRSYWEREDYVDGSEKQQWFSPGKFWINGGDKTALISACADNVTEKMTPLEYADLLFDAFGAVLLYNFKKIKKIELDEIKAEIEKDIVCSFPFPAPFGEQKYQGDDSYLRLTQLSNGIETILIDIPNVEIFYKQHYNEE